MDTGRVPSAELITTGRHHWLVSTVYHRSTRRFFMEVFHRSDTGQWVWQESYASANPESSRRWSAVFRGAERLAVELPNLPDPVVPAHLRDFPRYPRLTSASSTRATRLVPGWLALRIIGARIWREQRRLASR